MKSSGNEASRRRSQRCTLVDGYNVIAFMEKAGLAGVKDFEGARRQLIDLLSEYSAVTGEDVILVFDAHRVYHQQRQPIASSRIEVVFTNANETADERIERLVYTLRDRYRELTVATSDGVEQQVVFGGGALRVPARELIRRLEDARRQIRKDISRRADSQGPKLKDVLNQDIANILENWRRQ